VSGQESVCFSTLPHHPAGRRQTCRTRLSVDKSIEATTPHGLATWLASCVLGVARRLECSEVARTAYGACASDGRSVGAWTERALNLRGREGVLKIRNSRARTLVKRKGFFLTSRITLKITQADGSSGTCLSAETTCPRTMSGSSGHIVACAIVAPAPTDCSGIWRTPIPGQAARRRPWIRP
jgi:hypothetical protein